jgi:hypothetical protein
MPEIERLSIALPAGMGVGLATRAPTRVTAKP